MGAVFLLACAIVAPFVLPVHVVSSTIVVLHLCYLAQCWNIAAGFAGQFSLGHPLFFGIGAYSVMVLSTKYGISPWLGIVAGAAVAAAVAAAISWLVFRYNIRGVYFALVTLGCAEVVKGVADNWQYIGGSGGLLYPMRDAPLDFLFTSRIPYYYIILCAAVVLLVLTYAIKRGKFGQYLLAIREDEDAAEASGINTFRYKTYAISLSAALTSFGGAFYAQLYLYITPETVFAFEHQLNMMIGTMIGGAGTVMGPVVGAIVFSTIAERLRHLPFGDVPQVAAGSRIIYAILLLLVVLNFRGGLVGLAQAALRGRRR
ncbi:MAG: branched-chain amino acid ABC transporter permease [Hyphomicrobiaceae bacterium]